MLKTSIDNFKKTNGERDTFETEITALKQDNNDIKIKKDEIGI